MQPDPVRHTETDLPPSQEHRKPADRWIRRLATVGFGPGWSNPVRLAFVGGIMALVLPVLIFGPWLPLIDLVAFVGLYSYPPPFSQGPLHYYTFQFSYIAHHAISRFLCDLHLPIRFQIPFFHLFQTGVCYVTVYVLLRHVVQGTWLRCVGAALGTLALWDGIYLWGGPLAHSLGAAFLTLATILVFRDAATPGKNASGRIAILVVCALACHPFILPFAAILCLVRFLFDPARRMQTTLLGAAVLVFGYVIVRDSPPSEASATNGLTLLFGIRPAEIGRRLAGLFQHDALFARVLFGAVPLTSHVVFLVNGVLHAAGFVLSPWLALSKTCPKWARMLFTLNAIVGVTYLLSCDLEGTPIMDWPQRILTLYAPFTFTAGFAGIIYATTRFRPALVAKFDGLPRFAWTLPPLLLAFAVVVQAQVFRFSDELQENIAKVRSEIVNSGVSNAYVVVSGKDKINPFYLRCVPFLMFSDPAIIEKGILMTTEWHNKARHPTRIAESFYNLGRKRYLADFSSHGRKLAVRLIEQPMKRFPVTERTNQIGWTSTAVLASDQFKMGVELFQLGLYAAALEHFNTAVYLSPSHTDAWNNGAVALMQMERFDDAATYLEQALRVKPNHVDARFNLAAVHAARGRLSEAEAQLEQVLRLKPDHAGARELLGKIRAKSG